ncbi:MAG: S41 family peptidase [Mariniblastus sp.]
MNNTTEILRLIMLALLLFVAGNLVAADQVVAQQTIPDTPAAKRFEQVLAILNEGDEEIRIRLIRENFDDSDNDVDQICSVAKRLQAQFGGVTFQQETINKKAAYGGVCLTEKGMMIVASVEIGGDSNLITDVTIRPNEPEEELKAFGDFIPILTDGKSARQARGIWHAEGYGYVLEVTGDELNVYSYSGNFGWQIEFYENLLFRPATDKAKAQATLHPLEPGYTLTKLDALPDACKKTKWSSTELFDAFADVMTTHYPFFKVRNVDWQARLKEQRPKVKDGMSESELFDAMAAMLKDLNDGHVSLIAEIDGKNRKADIGSTGTVQKLKIAFKDQDQIKSFGIFYSTFADGFKSKIETDVLKGKSNSECNEQLIWGRVDEKVGYICIASMYGYGAGGITQQVEALHAGMNKILTELADTEALIIDISMNSGGTDSISVELASHFADKRRLGFSKWPAAVKAYRNDRYVVPFSKTSKGGVTYTKPVYVLQNDFSASAAEIFTMCMRSFPHVTTVGQPTSGALSDILNKQLPNGWELGISNEVYVDHKGVCYEGPGVPPEVEMEVFGNDIMKHDHAALLKKIVMMALNKDGK